MEKQRKKDQGKKYKCAKCDSSFGYPRFKKGEWVCRNCGYVHKIKEKIKREEKE